MDEPTILFFLCFHPPPPFSLSPLKPAIRVVPTSFVRETSEVVQAEDPVSARAGERTSERSGKQRCELMTLEQWVQTSKSDGETNGEMDIYHVSSITEAQSIREEA